MVGENLGVLEVECSATDHKHHLKSTGC